MTTTRKLALALCLASWYSLSSSQTTLNMGDDGYAGVNLGFSFPYYDKTFNQAYMYDNGVLSFLQPGTPDALSPWQWSSQPLNQTSAKYFIAPLWADIAPVAQTTYTTLGTATSQKFTWNNIAEYYSQGGALRLNSFSVEINENGDISSKYFGLNLRTSNISIGLKGSNDYTQIAYYPYNYSLTTQADWTANTKIAAPIAPVVPKQEPILEVEQPEPVIAQAPPTQTTTQTTSQPTSQQTSQVTSQSEAKAEKKVGAKAQQVDMSVVDAAISIAIDSSTSSSQQSTGFGINQSNQVALSLFNQASRQSVKQDENIQGNTGVGEKKDALDLAIMNSLQMSQSNTEVKDRGINKSVVANLELGQQLPLFTPLTLPDAPFYKPRQIYRNQKVVDNSRLLKSLNSERKFLEIIDGQYR
jgi:hypothetical protein